MELLDKILWTQVAKSIGFFVACIIISSIGWYWFGYLKGYAAGRQETEEAAEQLAAWMDEVNERLDGVCDELKQLNAAIRALQLPPYRQL